MRCSIPEEPSTRPLQGAVSAGVALVHQHIFDHPVVSVAFLPEANSSAYTIAIGFEVRGPWLQPPNHRCSIAVHAADSIATVA